MIVTDTSVSAAWLLPDESNAYADIVYAMVEVDGGLVTQHWHLEMRSALLRAERRRRMSADAVNGQLIRLNEIIALLQTDTTPNLDTAFNLARKHLLSFYDALYLELAIRRGAQLATLDSALDRAATAEGLPALM